MPLPKYPYEPAVWKQAAVGKDYLISDGKNKYSVPFDLIGEQVQIRLTKNTVEIFFKGNRAASHKRLEHMQTQPIVRPEHMPEKHRKYLSYNEDEFRSWAADVGRNTDEVVKNFLTSGKAAEQGFKSCVSLMKLGERYGKKELESACERMLAFSSQPSVRTISTILKNKGNAETRAKTVSAISESSKYGITRGAAYFKKGGDGNA